MGLDISIHAEATAILCHNNEKHIIKERLFDCCQLEREDRNRLYDIQLENGDVLRAYHSILKKRNKCEVRRFREFLKKHNKWNIVILIY